MYLKMLPLITNTRNILLLPEQSVTWPALATLSSIHADNFWKGPPFQLLRVNNFHGNPDVFPVWCLKWIRLYQSTNAWQAKWRQGQVFVLSENNRSDILFNRLRTFPVQGKRKQCSIPEARMIHFFSWKIAEQNCTTKVILDQFYLKPSILF